MSKNNHADKVFMTDQQKDDLKRFLKAEGGEEGFINDRPAGINKRASDFLGLKVPVTVLNRIMEVAHVKCIRNQKRARGLRLVDPPSAPAQPDLDFDGSDVKLLARAIGELSRKMDAMTQRLDDLLRAWK